MVDRKEYFRQYYQKHKDDFRKNQKRYYEKNKELLNARAVIWQKENVSRSAEIQKEWRATHPEEWKEIVYRSRYGIGFKAAQEKRAQQDGACNICEKKPKRLCLDHDHATGEFRGWLCHNCNVGLGSFKDNIESLQRAILYLKGEI